MSDIVERLRAGNGGMGVRHPKDYSRVITVAELNETADEIAALRAAKEQAERERDQYCEMWEGNAAATSAAINRALSAEEEIERMRQELDTMNRQHAASAKMMADLGRENERLRAEIQRWRDDALETAAMITERHLGKRDATDIAQDIRALKRVAYEQSAREEKA